MTKLPFPQSLAEKYRPRRISGFIGLFKVKKVLRSFLRNPFPGAWLFTGPSGTGKTSMALALARSLPAELHHVPSKACDLEELDRVCHMCRYVPQNAQWHLVLIDEADSITRDAQNALLSKTDATAAPPMTIFIFTANDTRLLEPRFLSRCHKLTFSAEETSADLPRYLRRVARLEGYRFPEDLALISDEAGANVRDALMRLEVELLAGVKLTRGVFQDAIRDQHQHSCPTHGAAWSCSNSDCALPWRSICAPCGGAEKTIYQLRAEKAVATRTSNILRMARKGRKGAA
jgi:DNA polymerase III gamma/tau subunit